VKTVKAATLVLFSAVTLLAQVYPPGTYPPGTYPPGTSPPGQNPPGTGPSIPRRGKKTDNPDQTAANKTVSGVVRAVEEKSFDLETEDTRILTIQFTDTVKLADVKPGDGVDVETTQDKNGLLQAVKIQPNAEIRQKILASYRAAEEEQGRTAPPPTILVRPSATHDADDSGPPKLKRGKPAQRASSKEDEDEDTTPSTQVAERTVPASPSTSSNDTPLARPPAPSTPPMNPRQAFIEKARGVAATYIDNLPNYICQEMVTRYVSESRQPNWRPLDVVSADLVYENHKESYRNLQINGKATKKKPEETGAWSTGEFGTILASLFDPGTDADFEFREEDTIAHRAASVYRFEVTRPRSNWKIWVPGQYIIPAYKGSVWIDKETANVLRIEMQAVDIPEQFPEISVESAVDYDYISLGTSERFLLPVHSEALDCARDSNVCERNTIEFRNYHKFTGESTIKYNE